MKNVVRTCFNAVLLFCIASCTFSKLRKEHPQEIGAIAESSARLAKIITRYVPKYGPTKRILEVGAGTGIFTEALIKKLRPLDKLDVVELTLPLCEILREKFFHNNQVTLYCGDILKWDPNHQYDYIVSGLPFNSFSEDLVRKITNKLVKLSKPGAIISFFEYLWLSSLRPLGMTAKEKEDFKKTRAAITEFIEKYEFDSDSTMVNMPPASVHYLLISK